jgi:hypothetical protein
MLYSFSLRFRGDKTLAITVPSLKNDQTKVAHAQTIYLTKQGLRDLQVAKKSRPSSLRQSEAFSATHVTNLPDHKVDDHNGEPTIDHGLVQTKNKINKPC